jgi:fructosamine-3-kinase
VIELPASLGAVVARERVAGGDINDAWALMLADGRRVFVKTRPGAAADEYATEAEGLAWLAQPGALRLPAVLAVDPAFLALEWIDAGRLSAAGEEELGRGLARMHAAGAPRFGGPRALWLGEVELSNAAVDGGWPAFLAQRRLLPLTRMAAQRGALGRDGVAAVERVCARLDELSGPPEPPARVHGDLWGGNVLGGADGRPWLIDPAAHGGHREADLALLRLFGGPGERTFAAYAEERPLADGWEDRVELHQLVPLLVHAVLFGGSYGRRVEAVARRYG